MHVQKKTMCLRGRPFIATPFKLFAPQTNPGEQKTHLELPSGPWSETQKYLLSFFVFSTHKRSLLSNFNLLRCRSSCVDRVIWFGGRGRTNVWLLHRQTNRGRPGVEEAEQHTHNSTSTPPNVPACRTNRPEHINTHTVLNVVCEWKTTKNSTKIQLHLQGKGEERDGSLKPCKTVITQNPACCCDIRITSRMTSHIFCSVPRTLKITIIKK